MAGAGHAVARVGPAGRWLVLALGAFALIATALFAAATLADREATLAQGRIEAENTAALLAEQADRSLRVAQLVAAAAADMTERHGVDGIRGERWGEFAALEHGAPEVGSLWLIDARGRLVASSLQREVQPVDLSDRDYFIALQAGALEFLQKLERGRASDTWFFGWARAVRAEGRFLGAVVAGLHGDEFARVAAGLALGPQAELRLLGSDGDRLMAWPRPDAERVLGDAWRSGSAGLSDEVGRDGVDRIVAWRASPTMPVVAVAALARAHVLAPFQRRWLRNSAFFALSLVLAGWLGVAALRAERRGAVAMRAAEERGLALASALAERTQLLASVQEGEARLRLAQQAGGIGLWDLELVEQRVALAGEVFGEWGLPGTEGRAFRPVAVRVVLRAMHPEDRGPFVTAVAAALRTGTPLDAEFRLLSAGQPERWIGVRAEPRAGAASPAHRLLGIALDVTPARSAQEALREAKQSLEQRVAERTGALAEANARLREGEARFRGLFNATFQFIGLLSPDGTVLEANAAMLRLGNMRLAEVVGRPYWVAPWWPEDAATRALLRGAIAEAAEGRFVRREAAMRDAAGLEVAVDFSVTPVRDEDGIVSLLVAEARDVSALKAAQALLLEAQKMDTLGQLTGGVAHDFNNLLMAVLGNLSLARRKLGDRAPDLLRHLDAATQAAERGATLTQRLLAFARRQDLKPASVDLRALLLGIEGLLRRSVGPLVTLELDAPEGLPAAHVDPHALELALVNLAVNARDAMPEGGRLAIRLALAEGRGPGRLGHGRWLTLAVADTGAGMDEATLTRAVEPFFTTKGPGQGTGLGLSMVHGLAAQSGGALVLESAPGRGTTATLWLPVSALAAVALEAAAEASPSPGCGAVLVVDDEALVLESTVAMLEALGYDPVPANSGEAALAILESRRDLVAVVTDHAMPGMTGAVLSQRIRARWPGMPVILATGHAGPWADAPGLPPRLAKPYSLTQLSTALRGVLARAAE